MRLNGQKQLIFTLMALGTLATAAQAAERVTLGNGFEMRCDHHAEVDGRVRLYPTRDEQSYMEFAPKEIAQVEVVTDLPIPAVTEAAANDVQAAGTPATPKFEPKPPALRDVKLSEADLHEILAKASGDHDLDADLLASVVKAESGGRPHAVSRTGARGLMQLMPGTARAAGVDDSFRPDENVRGGSTYLDALLIYYHNNLALALAAYNAGPAAVDRYHGIPPYHETKLYVARVMHEFNRRVLAREALARQLTSAAPVAGGSR